MENTLVDGFIKEASLLEKEATFNILQRTLGALRGTSGRGVAHDAAQAAQRFVSGPVNNVNQAVNTAVNAGRANTHQATQVARELANQATGVANVVSGTAGSIGRAGQQYGQRIQEAVQGMADAGGQIGAQFRQAGQNMSSAAGDVRQGLSAVNPMNWFRGAQAPTAGGGVGKWWGGLTGNQKLMVGGGGALTGVAGLNMMKGSSSDFERMKVAISGELVTGAMRRAASKASREGGDTLAARLGNKALNASNGAMNGLSQKAVKAVEAGGTKGSDRAGKLKRIVHNYRGFLRNSDSLRGK